MCYICPIRIPDTPPPIPESDMLRITTTWKICNDCRIIQVERVSKLIYGLNIYGCDEKVKTILKNYAGNVFENVYIFRKRFRYNHYPGIDLPFKATTSMPHV